MRWYIKVKDYNGPGNHSFCDWGGRVMDDINRAFQTLEKLNVAQVSWANDCSVEEYTGVELKEI